MEFTRGSPLTRRQKGVSRLRRRNFYDQASRRQF
jgi:hypothetical protein